MTEDRQTVQSGRAETVPVKREHVAMLYALARRADFADTYTTGDLVADFEAMRTLAIAAYHEAGMHKEAARG